MKDALFNQGLDACFNWPVMSAMTMSSDWMVGCGEETQYVGSPAVADHHAGKPFTAVGSELLFEVFSQRYARVVGPEITGVRSRVRARWGEKLPPDRWADRTWF